MKTIIYNIGTLAGILPAEVRKLEGAQMNNVECIENAYLVIEDGIITEFGQNMPEPLSEAIAASAAVSLASARCSENIEAAMTPDTNGESGRTSPSGVQGGRQREALGVDCEVIDAKGGFVMPTFCDSHTHIVYAGCRDGEFRDKIAGTSSPD